MYARPEARKKNVGGDLLEKDGQSYSAGDRPKFRITGVTAVSAHSPVPASPHLPPHSLDQIPHSHNITVCFLPSSISHSLSIGSTLCRQGSVSRAPSRISRQIIAF